MPKPKGVDMKASTVITNTKRPSKKAVHGVVNIAGKAKDYASGIGKLVWKDIKKLPGIVSRVPGQVSKAVRSKIEINIIYPKAVVKKKRKYVRKKVTE